MSILVEWKKWRLRRAKENYAKWKARHEAANSQMQLAIRNGDMGYVFNPYNRSKIVTAAGEEAKYLERVEELMRQ